MNFNLFRATTTKMMIALCVMVAAVGVLRAQNPAGGSQQLALANQKVSFTSTSLTVGKAIDEISRQSSYTFAFDGSTFDTLRDIRISDKELLITEALRQIASNQNVDYVVRGRLIAITAKPNSASKAAVRTPLTNDIYVKNSEGSIGANPNPRAKAEPQTQVIMVEEPALARDFTAPYSDYTPVSELVKKYDGLPTFAVKTNLLYAAAVTPNLGIEFRVGNKSTIGLSGSYTWYGREKDKVEDYKQFVHSVFKLEYRYWFCQAFIGHAIAPHILYGRHNISGYDVPMLFDKEYRYDGNDYGIGVSYVYHWAFAKRWGLELTAGVGYIYLNQKRYDCATCATNTGVQHNKNYFGPTELGVKLTFLIK